MPSTRWYSPDSPFPSFQVDSLGVTGEDVVYEGDEVDE